MEVPTVLDAQGNPSDKNDFITTQVIDPYISMLSEKKVRREKYDKVVSEIKENIALITDAQSANDFIERIDSFEHVGSSKAMAGQLLRKKAAELGLILKNKKYEQPAA